MIIDTFLFNNEFDMLDIHLKITENYVDKWIVLEANKTLSGLPKEFHLANNFQKYQQKYGNKLELVSIDLEPNHPHPSYYETGMRRGFRKSLEKYDQEDIIVHGDLDEIIDPTKWHKILQTLEEQNKPVSCTLQMYVYKFDQISDRFWKGSVVAKKRMFDTPHDLYKGNLEIVKRKDRNHCVNVDEVVGWHWTWFGSDEIIKNKVDSLIEHRGRNPEEVLDAFKKVDTKTAINHKVDSKIILPVYPDIVLKIIKNYSDFWHQVPR